MAIIKIEEKYEYLKDVLLSILLIGIAFVINAGMSIRGLYQDDLFMWSTRRGVGFFKYVFPDQTRKFRPVYWIVAWIYQGILKNNISLIVPINIIIAAIIAIGVYFFAKEMAKSRGLAFTLASMFLISRFSYYNIGQFLGVMEAMALVFALLMLYFLYLYIKNGKGIYFYYACGFYFLNCFTHERFMVLLPMLIFAAIVGKRRKILNALISISLFVLITLIRLLALKSFMPEGTGGSKVSETFNIADFFHSMRIEILYLLGINTGPEHLNGINFHNVNTALKLVIIIGILAAFAFIIKFIYSIAVYRKKIELSWIKNILLFTGFIIGSMVSSAVTIRVEMRWVYAPYLFMLLLISYIYGADKSIIVKRVKSKKIKASPGKIFHVSFTAVVLLFVWAFCMITADIYYRGYYDNIYIFIGQNRANSLADETYYKYGKDLRDKRIFIIKNDFKLSKFDSLEFFRSYDQNIREDIVTFIENYRSIGQIDDDMIVLSEDLKNNSYQDVTDFLRNLKIENVYGHYSDGWTDEEAKLNVMSGEKGEIHFEIMYPGELDGDEEIEIEVNGEKETLYLVSNITQYEIDTTPNSLTAIHLKSNFYLPDASEQRGEDRLSYILNIKID